MITDEIMLKVENVSKVYKLGEIGGTTLRDELQRAWAKIRKKEDPTKKIGAKNYNKGEKFKALDSISFEVKKGERIGIIGHNGAGKSTLLKLISRVTGPTQGKIYLNGRVASMLEVGTGFHSELTGRENIYLNGAILGMTKKEVDAKMEDIIDFSEVRQFIDTPVKRYSSGMYVKLAFSVAAHLDSEIMIMDEVLAVGDVAFQNKCLNKMKDVSEQEDRTILYVSHNMNTIRQLCDRVIVLDHGHIVFDGDVESGISKYLSVSRPKIKDYDLLTMRRKNKHITNDIIFSRAIINNLELKENRAFNILLYLLPKKNVESVVLRIILTKTDGTPVMSFFTNPKDYPSGFEYIEEFSFDFESLAPGNYCFRMVAFTPSEQDVQIRHDSIEDVLLFDVVDNYNFGLNWKSNYWGNFTKNISSFSSTKHKI